MGRLEEIVERNKHPRRYRKKGVTMGLLLGLFVFVILVLVIFTDFEDRPVKPTAPAADSGDKRVEGVMIYREPARDAAIAD